MDIFAITINRHIDSMTHEAVARIRWDIADGSLSRADAITICIGDILDSAAYLYGGFDPSCYTDRVRASVISQLQE